MLIPCFDFTGTNATCFLTHLVLLLFSFKKTLIELMGGEIYLDPEYHSGVAGHPGTRFVVDLKQAPIEQPLDMDANVLGMLNSTQFNGNKSDNDTASASHWSSYELPEKCKILFVDDDPILRKVSHAKGRNESRFVNNCHILTTLCLNS